MANSPIKDSYNSNAKLAFNKNYTPLKLNFINEQEIFNGNTKNICKDEYYFEKIYNYTLPLFPIIMQSNNERWLVADLYFHHLIENDPFLNFKTLTSKANHLLHFLRFTEHKNLSITYSPKEKYKRITYQFLRELNYLVDDGTLGFKTAQHRINEVINFYETCINNEYIKKQDISYPLYNIEYYIHNRINATGLRYSKKQRRTDLKIRSTNPKDKENSIQSKRELRPLTENNCRYLMQILKYYDDYQFSLMCYIAIFTGARIQTVCNLRAKDIKLLIINNDTQRSPLDYNEYILNVGGNTEIGTKNSTSFKLYIPEFLIKKLYVYILSPKWEKRESKLNSKDKASPYLFITKHGNPYYSYNNDATAGDEFNEIYDGTAVRMKIRKLIQVIQSVYPEFKKFTFHDLRATFAVNFLQHMESIGFDANSSLHELSERMGHANLESTMPYIRYYKNKAKLKKITTDYQNFLFNLDD